MNKTFFIIAAIVIAAVVTLLFAQNKKGGELISPKDAHALMQKDTSAVVLDVRTADEYYSETGHLPKAILMPVQALEERIGALDQYKDK
ncbi:MAG: rhodanese-like domain-containing protein, partial [Acidobacteriota bacterium]